VEVHVDDGNIERAIKTLKRFDAEGGSAQGDSRKEASMKNPLKRKKKETARGNGNGG